MGNYLEDLDIVPIGGEALQAARLFKQMRKGRLSVCPDGTYDVWLPEKALFNFRKNGMVAYFIKPDKKNTVPLSVVLDRNFVI